MHGAVFLHVVLTGAELLHVVTSAAEEVSISGAVLDIPTASPTDAVQALKIASVQPCSPELEYDSRGVWNEMCDLKLSKKQIGLEFIESIETRPNALLPKHLAARSQHLAARSQHLAARSQHLTYEPRENVLLPTTKEVLVISLVNELFREFDNCALVIVHDASNGQLAKALVEQEKFAFQPKAVFNLGIMSEKELSLMPSWFSSLRASSCANYLLLSADAAAMQRILQNLSAHFTLNRNAKFVIIAGATSEAHMLKFFRSPPVDGIRDVLLVTPTASGSWLRLSTHRFFSASARVEIQSLGFWGSLHAAAAARKENWTRPKTFFPQKLKNFNGFQLKVSTFNYPPVVIWDPNDSCEDGNSLTNTKCADGLEIRILKTIAEALNFSAWLQEPKDGELWGAILENGSWTGAFGEVMRREVDVSFANYFVTKDRLLFMDMTTSHSVDYACFITPIPPPPPQYTVVVRPFHYIVWIGLVLSILLMTPFLMLTSPRVPVHLSFRDLLGKSLMFLWAIQMSQSLHDQILPSTAPLRLCFISFCLASFIVSVAYRSSLFSYLLVPAASAPVDTLQQLLDSGLKWGIRDSGGWGLWFSDSNDPTTRKIYEGFECVHGIENGIKMVQNGDFAFMNSGRFLRYLVASNFTDVHGQAELHVSRECFVPFRIGLGTPRFSVYTASFTTVVNRLVEAGLVTKWFSDLLYKAAEEQRVKARGHLGGLSAGPHEHDDSSTVLGLYHLQGVYILLVLGYGVSCLVFIFEVAAHRLR